jgi:hypothetical protein
LAGQFPDDGQTELIEILPKNGSAKAEHPCFLGITARNNRSFNWFMIGEKENRTINVQWIGQWSLFSRCGSSYEKCSFGLESNRHHMAATVSHRFSGTDRKST